MMSQLQKVPRSESQLWVEGFWVVRDVFSHGPPHAGKMVSRFLSVPFPCENTRFGRDTQCLAKVNQHRRLACLVCVFFFGGGRGAKVWKFWPFGHVVLPRPSHVQEPARVNECAWESGDFFIQPNNIKQPRENLANVWNATSQGRWNLWTWFNICRPARCAVHSSRHHSLKGQDRNWHRQGQKSFQFR